MRNWILLMMVASLAGAAFAQTEPAAKKRPPAKQEQKKEEAAKPETKKAPIVKFSMGMIESGRIDLRYAGFPIGEVVDAIEKMTGSKKGEFESTADYNARKAAALKAKFLGDSSIEDTFAFVVPVLKDQPYLNLNGFGYAFDADASELRLFVLPKSSFMNGIGGPDPETTSRGSRDLDQFDLESRTISRSRYEGSNAYGAKVTVEKTISNSFGIAANRIPFLSFKRALTYGKPVPAVQLGLENARAAKELPTLKALVVMQLATPFIAYNFIHKEATRDSPSELSVQGKYLTGNILGVVFYSGITGEIFARVPDTFGRTETKVESKPDEKPAAQ